jgi:hypothetical protein
MPKFININLLLNITSIQNKKYLSDESGEDLNFSPKKEAALLRQPPYKIISISI